MSFENNVFINCPLDNEHLKLLRAMVFTIIFLGMEPRLSVERSDSSENRLSKIVGLIKQSQYSIHDISLMKSSKKSDFMRMNMPFELGIDYGIKVSSEDSLYKDKKFLILEKQKYDYQKAISDIAGHDICAHKDDPFCLITIVRNWLYENTSLKKVKSATDIWNNYAKFTYAMWIELKSEGFSEEELNNMPILETIDFAYRWVAGRRD